MGQRLARLALMAVKAAAIVWVVIFAGMIYWQRALLYVPVGEAQPPAAVGLASVSETSIRTPDGARLTAWLKDAAAGQPTILYFHGNSGVLAFRAERFKKFVDQGWGLFAFSYRSFNGSTGEPTEALNVADAMLAYDQLIARGADPRSIVIFGESLGTGVAVQVAEARACAGVVLDSAYTSIADVAAGRFPMFPVRLVLQDTYDTASRIADLKVPLLMFHAKPDVVIPLDLGQRLYALAPEPKQLIVAKEGWHVSAIELTGTAAMTSWMKANGILPKATTTALAK